MPCIGTILNWPGIIPIVAGATSPMPIKAKGIFWDFGFTVPVRDYSFGSPAFVLKWTENEQKNNAMYKRIWMEKILSI